MLNITAAQTLFSGIGISLTTLGVIFLLVPKRTRFGILTILLSNIPFVTAIALPKKVSETFLEYGFDSEFLKTDFLYLGVGLGVLLFVLWYGIRTLFVKLLNKLKDRKNTQPDKKEEKNLENNQKSDENLQKSDKNEENLEKAKTKAEKAPAKEKIEPGFGPSNLANPHLFDNLRLDKLKAKDD